MFVMNPCIDLQRMQLLLPATHAVTIDKAEVCMSWYCAPGIGISPIAACKVLALCTTRNVCIERYLGTLKLKMTTIVVYIVNSCSINSAFY